MARKSEIVFIKAIQSYEVVGERSVTQKAIHEVQIYIKLLWLWVLLKDLVLVSHTTKSTFSFDTEPPFLMNRNKNWWKFAFL